MAAGVVGSVFTTTSLDAAALVPQAFMANTEMVPAVAPAVIEMELVVEVPDQPCGSVHW
jgi:hypothetical protein